MNATISMIVPTLTTLQYQTIVSQGMIDYNGSVSVRTTCACNCAPAHRSQCWCATSAEALPIVVPSAPPSLVGMTQHEVI